jgi:hypothetical protein
VKNKRPPKKKKAKAQGKVATGLPMHASGEDAYGRHSIVNAITY